MRISRLRLPLIIALLAVVGLLCGVPPTDAAECKLPDGSVLRLEITYGKWSPLKLGGPWEPIKEKLRRFQLELKYGPLPGLGSGPSTWSSDFAWHTNANALHIWVTRRYPTSGPTMSQRVNVEAMQFVDDDGCIFPATQVGGGFQELVSNTLQHKASIEAEWFTFEAFPRHEAQLRLRIYEYSVDHKLLAEVRVANPAPHPRGANWVAEPLPNSKVDGDVTFMLKGATFKTNFNYFRPKELRFGHPLEIVPLLEVLDHGKPTVHRDALDLELYDSSGNCASKMYGNSLFLCPKETAWKLRVRFFGSKGSQPDVGAVWTIHGMKVPARGEFVALTVTNKLDGVSVRTIALAGAGNVLYKNNVAVRSSVGEAPGRNYRGIVAYSGIGSSPDYNLQTTNAHLALELGAMTHDQRLTVQATDDQGREVYAYPYDWDWGRPSGVNHVYKPNRLEPLFLFLDLPADSKTVDLTFRMHTPRTVEFIFKPPALKDN